MAKHLTWNKEIITFDDSIISKTPEILELEMKLHIVTKKYYKYKAKYLETKDIQIDSIVKFNTPFDKINYVSETSSILHKM